MTNQIENASSARRYDDGLSHPKKFVGANTNALTHNHRSTNQRGASKKRKKRRRRGFWLHHFTHPNAKRNFLFVVGGHHKLRSCPSPRQTHHNSCSFASKTRYTTYPSKEIQFRILFVVDFCLLLAYRSRCERRRVIPTRTAVNEETWQLEEHHHHHEPQFASRSIRGSW